MPRPRPLRPCLHHGCPNYAERSYCPEHQRDPKVDVRHSHWWRQLRQKVLDMNGRRCAECGITEQQLRARNRGNLQLHHVDGDKDNCQPTNLVPLCPPDHVKAQMQLRWGSVKARRARDLPPYLRD